MDQVKRLQFDFSPDAYKRLEDLKRRMDASTKAEVVRNALKLYELFATQVNPEYIVEIKDQKDERVVFRMPAKALLS
jgi:hypothetical protein